MAGVVHPPVAFWEYLGLQDDVGWTLPVEYVEGEPVVVTPVGAAASLVQGELHFALRAWQSAAGDEGVLLQDVFVRLPDEQVVAPDLAWWVPGREVDTRRGTMVDVPDLVVEVLSPRSRAYDLETKRRVYERAGVPELWIADPDARTIAIVGAHERVLREGDVLTSASLPGLELPVASAFAKL